MNAVVTGASGGIGREICAKLYQCGYDIIAQLNTGCEESVKEVIEYDKQRLHIFRADFSKREEIERFATFIDEMGGADILINNAGMSIVKLLDMHTADEIFGLMQVNAAAAIYLCSSVLPGMLKKRSGSIVNISSIWGEYGASCETVYSASKAALIGFSKALQKELDGSGINVSCLVPGFVNTSMNDHLSQEEIDEFVKDTPLGRAISAKEIANKVAEMALSSVRGKIEIFE